MLKMTLPTRRLTGLSLFAGLCAVLTGCVSVDLAALLEPRLEEVRLRKAAAWTPHKILVVDISGFIGPEPNGQFSLINKCCPDAVTAMLKRAERDSAIKAVVLRIDTPGGGVAPTDMIHHEIRTFQRRTGRPVVAMIMGMGCSGGYYIANAADAIFAHPSSVTGSIGVIAVFPRIKKLADKIGWEQTVIKSGRMKDIGNPLREMPDEERRILQEMIDGFYGQFLDAVIAGRPKYHDRTALKPVADGRVYTAKQALEHGLIDRIAYFDDVLAQAKEAAGIRNAHVIAYHYGRREDATVYSSTSSRSPVRPLVNVDLQGLLGTPAVTGFHYLWMPGTP